MKAATSGSIFSLKALLIISILGFFSFVVAAQEKEHQCDSVTRKSIYAVANIISPAKKQMTSLDSIPGQSANKKSRLDSLKKISSRPAGMLDSLQKVSSAPADKLNSLQKSSSAKIDSLKNIIRLPVLKMQDDSLSQKPGAAVAGAAEKIEHTEDRLQAGVDSLGNKVTRAADKVQQSIENKVQRITGEKIDLPDQKLPVTPDVNVPGDISIPSADKGVPSVESLKTPAIAAPSVWTIFNQ